MIDPAIIEAAARALCEVGAPRASYDLEIPAVIVGVDEASVAVLTAVTPLIEAAALEKAAKVAEEWEHFYVDSYFTPDECGVIADAIRALSKEQS